MSSTHAGGVPRAPLVGLAAAFMGFAAYGSFVPFDLKRVALAEAVERFAATPYVPLAEASKTDLLTNVLLFVPIGFFLLGALAARSRRLGVAAWPFVVAAGFTFATAIEFGQIFVSGRTPSWNDVAAETIGTTAGAALWILAGPFVAGWFQAAGRSASPTDRLYRILGIYAALWLLLGLLPFDYTVRPQELAEKFRAGRIVLQPFGPGTTATDVVGTFLMAAPLGVFGLLWGRQKAPGHATLAGVLLGTAGAAVVEFAQLLAVSRVADVTDVLANVAGVGFGVWLGATLGHPLRAEPHRQVRLWPLVGLVAWTALLVIRHWSPFDFTADGHFLRSRVDLMLRVPFHSYYWGMPLFSFAEASTKFLLGMPVGALWQLTWSPPTARWRLIHSACGVVTASVLFTAIEVGQLALPSRVPDQTDIYIALAGAVAGIAAARSVATNVSVRGDNSRSLKR